MVFDCIYSRHTRETKLIPKREEQDAFQDIVDYARDSRIGLDTQT